MEQIDINDARHRLDELLMGVGSGEKFILMDAGRRLALLTAPPPPPPTEEELAAKQAELEAIVQEMLRTRAEQEATSLTPETPRRRKAARTRGTR